MMSQNFFEQLHLSVHFLYLIRNCNKALTCHRTDQRFSSIIACQCRLLYCRLRPHSSNVRFSSFCTYTTVPNSTQNCASTITSASVPRVSSPAFANGSCTNTDSASEIHPVFHHSLPQHACANAQVSPFCQILCNISRLSLVFFLKQFIQRLNQ